VYTFTGAVCIEYLGEMVFPAKTDRARILAAAMEQLAREGMEKLSLRSVAASLDLAPNALYRYFASRSQLEAAIAAEITAHVHESLGKAAARKPPEQAIRALVRAYIRFAHEHKHLYEAFVRPCVETSEGEAAHVALWDFVLEQVGRVSGPKKAAEAAIALWALLHGFIGLANAGVFERDKPRSGFDWGLQAWFRAARG
jgi:AcrR family transcriptional regulator